MGDEAVGGVEAAVAAAVQSPLSQQQQQQQQQQQLQQQHISNSNNNGNSNSGMMNDGKINDSIIHMNDEYSSENGDSSEYHQSGEHVQYSGSLPMCSFFFCEERHYRSLVDNIHNSDETSTSTDTNGNNIMYDNNDNALIVPGAYGGLVSKWRMKDRMKTVAVGIALCLNIGVDPPDVIRIPPCAKLQAWMDPFQGPPNMTTKTLEQIGKRLQNQYERWQPRARYKTSLDPTFEDIRKLCGSCRRHAKGERVLFHYNGHGVPRPTTNGELWVFNSTYTQYIPLSVYDLQTWLQAPAIYIFDCSNAGVILNAFCQFAEQRCSHEDSALARDGGSISDGMGGLRVGGKRLLQDSIVLAACGAKERLPQDANLPADIFTACLTTPIKTALWWFCDRSLLREEGINQSLVDRIPGRQADRKTPLGELNWIFTAITDTIAWNMLPRALFQRLFRQDLLVASLFRNYLLAERVLHSVSCTPVSYPELPSTHQHTMWSAWDMAAEGCLAQLPAILSGESDAEYVVSPFFSQQLQAFEVWLQHGHPGTNPPEQLPIVLQVLLSQSHRLKALILLGRFLDMGPWAVDLALSVGIFPYVLKLLQTTATDLRQILIFIWAKILALDRKCQVDLTKDNGHEYFVRFLEAPDISPSHQSMAAFCLASIMDGYPRGKAACASAGVMGICLMYISTALSKTGCDSNQLLLLRWLCLCLGKLWEDERESQMEAMEGGAPDTIAPLLQHPSCSPEVRAAAIFALGNTVHLPVMDKQFDKTNNGGTDSIPDTPTQSNPSSVANGNSFEQPSSAPASGVTNQEGGVTDRRVSTSGGQEAHPNLQRNVNHQSVPAIETLEATTRLGAERSVALHMLSSVFDGSPLVRKEIAVYLGRFVLAHRSFMQPTIDSWLSSHKKYDHMVSSKGRHNRLQFLDVSLRHRKTTSNGSNGDAPRMMEHSLSPNSGPNLSSSSASDSNSFNMQMSSSNGSIQAYSRVLDGLVTLVIDPFPKIAQAAKTSLNMIGLDIENYVPRMKLSSFSKPTMSFNAKVSSPQSTTTAKHQESTQGNRYSFISRLPSLMRTPSTTSIFSSASPTTTREIHNGSASPSSSNHLVNDRSGGHSNNNNNNNGDVSSKSFSPIDGSTPTTTSNDLFPSSQWPTHGHGVQPITRDIVEKLPKSTIYDQSCHHFSQPLWDSRQTTEVPSIESRWIVPSYSKFRTSERRKFATECAERCRMSRISRFSDVVGSIQLNNFGPASAMIFSGHEPYVCCASKHGDVSIWNMNEGGSLANRFHMGSTQSGPKGVIGVKAPSPACSLHIINEFDSPMLAAGSCDGCIRVWRDPFGGSFDRETTLVTAWQAAAPTSSGQISTFQKYSSFENSDINAQFQWQQHTGLFLVGGADKRVRVWDVCKERCIEIIDGQVPAAISSMSASEGSGISVVVGYENGCLQHFDLRDPCRIASTILPPTGNSVVSSSILGLTMKLAVGHQNGSLSMYDMRQRSWIWQVQAHSSVMHAMAVHPHCNIISSSDSSSVKVFNQQNGSLISTIRQRGGSASIMAFHPAKALMGSMTSENSLLSLYGGDGFR